MRGICQRTGKSLFPISVLGWARRNASYGCECEDCFGLWLACMARLPVLVIHFTFTQVNELLDIYLLSLTPDSRTVISHDSTLPPRVTSHTIAWHRVGVYIYDTCLGMNTARPAIRESSSSCHI